MGSLGLWVVMCIGGGLSREDEESVPVVDIIVIYGLVVFVLGL